MLNTHPQWLLAIIFVIGGIVCGMTIGILQMIHILLGKRKWVQTIVDIICCIIATIIYIIVLNLFNWGEHRMYLLIAHIIGIFVERKTLGKLFAKLYYKLYNLIVNKMRKVSNSKLGAFLKR
ncbi:MAG: hypothetical protein E7361_02975 [Clostridiales bacterium]|nr:hypothetical protein [Clostridiales bacterium]